MAKNAVDWIALVLVIIGALNWGIIAVAKWFGSNFDLVASWLPAWLANVVYLLVGIAGLYSIYSLTK